MPRAPRPPAPPPRARAPRDLAPGHVQSTRVPPRPSACRMQRAANTSDESTKRRTEGGGEDIAKQAKKLGRPRKAKVGEDVRLWVTDELGLDANIATALISNGFKEMDDFNVPLEELKNDIIQGDFLLTGDRARFLRKLATYRKDAAPAKYPMAVQTPPPITFSLDELNDEMLQKADDEFLQQAVKSEHAHESEPLAVSTDGVEEVKESREITTSTLLSTPQTIHVVDGKVEGKHVTEAEVVGAIPGSTEVVDTIGLEKVRGGCLA